MNHGHLRIGLLGCGNVGSGVVQILREHGGALAGRLGAGLEIKAIAVRDLSRDRGPEGPAPILLTDDAQSVVNDPEIDVVLELMGGVETATDLVLQALANGKQVVTANKAMIAQEGRRIFEAAQAADRDVLFEAAVGGGMPVIRSLREGLAGDHIQSLHAIINGTSNYILSAMSSDGLPYEEALEGAQQRGYAEADPTMDVEGTDAAQKLSILMAIAFGVDARATSIPTRGIDAIGHLDVAYARGFGCVVKPLAVAQWTDRGLEAHVGPCLVPEGATLAKVSGALNAVRIQGEAVGPLLIEGAGAGSFPTASAVMGDLVDAGRNRLLGCQGKLPPPPLGTGIPWKAPERRGRFYARFAVEDAPGVLGSLAAGLGREGVSIAQVVQDLPDGAAHVQVALLTHETSETGLNKAIGNLAGESWVLEPPMVMGLEDRL